MTSKKHIVRMPSTSLQFAWAESTFAYLPDVALPDVAEKLGLIAPIAEQCQHKCVCHLTPLCGRVLALSDIAFPQHVPP